MEQELEKDNGRDMTPRLIGETYMKYPTEKSRQKYRYGLYECQYCGKEWETTVKSVKCGDTKSCGCQRGLGHKHGLGSHRLYPVWYAMKQRCTNPKSSNYKNYGGRGIKVCEEWLDIRNFIEWAELTYSEGLSLDRINNDGNYEPNNCRWTDATTQNINKRIKKTNTSGFVGINLEIRCCKWVARVSIAGKENWIGSFKTIEEAVQARDTYIISNNLPHKLSTEYKKEHQ